MAVEIGYFRSVMRKESEQLRWAWIVLGNIVSNVLLLGLAIVVRILQADRPEFGLALLPYQGLFLVMHLTISFSMVTAALAEPTIRLLRLPLAAQQPEAVSNQEYAHDVAEGDTPNQAMQPAGICGGEVDPENKSVAPHIPAG
jgi:hypothetical protein